MKKKKKIGRKNRKKKKTNTKRKKSYQNKHQINTIYNTIKPRSNEVKQRSCKVTCSSCLALHCQVKYWLLGHGLDQLAEVREESRAGPHASKQVRLGHAEP